MYFETTERHFFFHNKKDVIWGFQCAAFKFVLVGDPKMNSKEIHGCRVKPGEQHNHELLSQEVLELQVIRWECLLRTILHGPQETKLLTIASVLSSWPHKISVPSSVLECKFSQFLSYYRNRAKNKEFVRSFLAQFGEDKVAYFRQVVLQSAPALPGQFFF